MDQNKNLPLTGVKVVELATVVAAPTTSRMLCAYGAEVVKIESPRGDEMRRAGITEHAPYEDYNNPLFTVHNSNKRLVAINIKSEKGREALFRLLDSADVFITNVRGPSLTRLGLDYDSVKARYPRLIYAHFTGYGPQGPSANDPGFDSTAFWLRCGPMADWQVKGSFPFVPTYAFGDMATSSVLLSGILMALYHRTQTGCGTKVETSLFASGIWCNSVGVVSTQFDRKYLNPDPNYPTDPFETYYECADGRWIGIYVNEYDRDLEKFARLLGLEDILDDPRYASIAALAESGVLPEAVRRIGAVFKTRTSSQWREFLAANSVSCEVLRYTKEVCTDEQAIANHYVEKMTYQNGMEVVMPCPPIHFSDLDRREYANTGRIGEDTDEVFLQLGYSAAEIKAMKHNGDIK